MADHDPPALALVAEPFGNTNEETRRFLRAFRGSGLYSIDAFLARRMEEFGGLGKLAIAHQLCPEEIPAKVVTAEGDDQWYHALWNAMVSDANGMEDVAANPVRFVTFDYDRSLEYSFYESFRNTFGIERARRWRSYSV